MAGEGWEDREDLFLLTLLPYSSSLGPLRIGNEKIGSDFFSPRTFRPYPRHYCYLFFFWLLQLKVTVGWTLVVWALMALSEVGLANLAPIFGQD